MPTRTETTPQSRPPAHGPLIQAATASGDGEWVQLDGIRPVTFTVEGTFSATIIVSASNALTRPLNTDHGIILTSFVSANGTATFDENYKWIKARVATYSSGTISAYFFAG
jgi:hypothetical protein